MSSSYFLFGSFLYSLFVFLCLSATYKQDPTFKTNIKVYMAGVGMWVSPKDESIYLVVRISPNGPYQFYGISMIESNNITNIWMNGDWDKPIDIEIDYDKTNNNITKFWFGDAGYAVLSRFNVAEGLVDGQIGTENNRGTNDYPIQFETPAALEFVPGQDSNGNRWLFFGDSEPYSSYQRFGKLLLLYNESSMNHENQKQMIKTQTLYVIGTNGTVSTNVPFKDIATMAYDPKRKWIWLDDAAQSQVYVYDGDYGNYVGMFPCNKNYPNGGAYFDRKQNIFWQILIDKIQAFNLSSIHDINSLNNFDCNQNSIFYQTFNNNIEGQPTALAIDSMNSDVYLALSFYDNTRGCTIYRYKLEK